MPELPEVETVVRTLEKQIKDCQIKDVHIFYDKILKDPKHFKEMVVGQHFRFFMRRGKYPVSYTHVTLPTKRIV